MTLQWRHNECNSVSNHQPHECLLNCLFRHRSKKTSKLCITGLCVGNSPLNGEFPAQKGSNAENVSIWWSHHDLGCPDGHVTCDTALMPQQHLWHVQKSVAISLPSTKLEQNKFSHQIWKKIIVRYNDFYCPLGTIINNVIRASV